MYQKKRHITIIIILSIIVFLSFSCTKKNAEELRRLAELENHVCEDDSIASDTTLEEPVVEISYKNNVAPLLETHCTRCHSPSGNTGYIPLHNYESVILYIPNPLLGTIKHESGYSKMPLSAPKLSDGDIKLVEDWINQGAKNN